MRSREGRHANSGRAAPRPMRSREGREAWERTLALIAEWELESPRPKIPNPNRTPAASSPATDRPYSEEREVPSATTSAPRGTSKAAVRVRHSAMYSDRPRRPRGGWAQESTSSRVEEQDAGSNDIGPTISDTSKFETLSLNDSSPPLDSDDWSEELSTADLLLRQPKFDSIDDAMDYLCNRGREQRERDARNKALPLPRQSSLDKFEAQRMLVPPKQAQPVAPAVAPEGRHKGSREKIAENGKKWMSEEVRVAFQKYLQKKDDLKEFDFEFEELQHQCFHVENYCKIFHHFNFTVKLKEPGSSEWISTLYFAEVKEILTRKIYFCCPLEPYENGDCYACKNQRMDDLKHPMIGAFDRGSPDTVFPFIYGSDSSDDEDGPVCFI